MSEIRLQQIDEALKRLPVSPETDEDIAARAALQTEYLTLQQSMKNYRQPVPEKLIAVRPPDGIDHIVGAAGSRRVAELDHNGHRVIRMTWEDFALLMMLRDDGREWARRNVDHVRHLLHHTLKGI